MECSCDWDCSYLSLLQRWECGGSGKWVACPKTCKHKWWSRNSNSLKSDTKVKALLLCYFPPRCYLEIQPCPYPNVPRSCQLNIQAELFTFPNHSTLTGAIHLCPPKLDNWTHWDAGSWLCFPSNHTFHWLSSPHCHYTVLTHALILGPMESHPGGAVCWQAEWQREWMGGEARVSILFLPVAIKGILAKFSHLWEGGAISSLTGGLGVLGVAR